MEERIISSLSLASLTDEVIPSESKSDDRAESSISMDCSSQDVMQDSKTDISAHVIVTSEQAACHSETACEELESFTNNTQDEWDLNENGVNENREEMKQSSQTVSEDEASADVESSEPIAVITEPGNTGEGGAEKLHIGSEGNGGQMLKVIVPKHLLPAIKQISLPSVLLSRCPSSKPVPLK